MKRILILGMGRSGTTYITELLGKCGVYLDQVNWAQEHELARLINDSYLERVYGARPGMPYGRLPAQELEPDETWRSLSAMFVRYMDLQARASSNCQYWSFKDPRSTVLHALWLDHFDVVVGMFRAPQEVVDSYVGKKWVSGLGRRNMALGYWLRFNRSLLHVSESCKGQRPFYLLNYNDDQTRQVEFLCEHLDLAFTPEARALYRPSLKHYTSTELPQDRAVRDMYNQLLSLRIRKP